MLPSRSASQLGPDAGNACRTPLGVWKSGAMIDDIRSTLRSGPATMCWTAHGDWSIVPHLLGGAAPGLKTSSASSYDSKTGGSGSDGFPNAEAGIDGSGAPA